MRKTIKIAHSIASAGLIGGLASYMLLLVAFPVETTQSYADLRTAILAISNYVLLPSLAIGLITGILAMMVHAPFMDRGWVWVKAVLGILMFKGVLTIIYAKADHAARVSDQMARGEAGPDALANMLAGEWWTLVIVMGISLANIVLGVWRPRLVPAPKPDEATASTTRDSLPGWLKNG